MQNNKKAGLRARSGMIAGLWISASLIYQGLVGRMKKFNSDSIMRGMRRRLMLLAGALALALFIFFLAAASRWGGGGIEALTLVWIPATVYIAQRLPRDVELVAVASRGRQILKGAGMINRRINEKRNYAVAQLARARHSTVVDFSKLDGIELTKAAVAFACACSMATIGGRETWESLEAIKKPAWAERVQQLEMGIEGVEIIQPGAKRWHPMGLIARLLAEPFKRGKSPKVALQSAARSTSAAELRAAYYRAIWIDADATSPSSSSAALEAGIATWGLFQATRKFMSYHLRYRTLRHIDRETS